jgi:hypothetical protein
MATAAGAPRTAGVQLPAMRRCSAGKIWRLTVQGQLGPTSNQFLTTIAGNGTTSHNTKDVAHHASGNVCASDFTPTCCVQYNPLRLYGTMPCLSGIALRWRFYDSRCNVTCAPWLSPDRCISTDAWMLSSVGKERGMAYQHKNGKGTMYYLHTKKAQLKNGRVQQIYFFAKDIRKDSELNHLPEGYEVSEVAGSGMPVLKKKVKAK